MKTKVVAKHYSRLTPEERFRLSRGPARADAACEAGSDVASEEASVLTVKQVAERLGVSLSAVYLMVETGLLECHRIRCKPGTRGAIRISEEQLQAYFETTKQGPVRAPPAPAPEKVPTASFTVLDADRLKEAWQNR